MFIEVMIKDPGSSPRVERIENSLESLQKTVGGYIQAVPIPVMSAQGLVVICDEEGRLKDKPYNCHVAGIGFVGRIILCGSNKDEFADIPKGIKNSLLSRYGRNKNDQR